MSSFRPASRGSCLGIRRGPEPYRQGDLDGLCGLYCIVNAMSILCPELNERQAEKLFIKLLRSLISFVEEPIEIVYEGMDDSVLRHLLTIAQSDVESRFKVCLKIRPFRRTRGRKSLPQVWRVLQERLTPRLVAIAGLDGLDYHWTCIYAISSSAIGFLDSSDLRSLPRSQVTLEPSRKRYRLVLEEVIFVERVD